MLKIILIILVVLIITSFIEITMYNKKVKQDEKEIEEAMNKFLGGNWDD